MFVATIGHIRVAVLVGAVVAARVLVVGIGVGIDSVGPGHVSRRVRMVRGLVVVSRAVVRMRLDGQRVAGRRAAMGIEPAALVANAARVAHWNGVRMVVLGPAACCGDIVAGQELTVGILVVGAGVHSLTPCNSDDPSRLACEKLECNVRASPVRPRRTRPKRQRASSDAPVPKTGRRPPETGGGQAPALRVLTAGDTR
jgi:hypothetical protein